MQHLLKNNFDCIISSKILLKPAVKDFQNIIIFLFRQIDNNYEVAGRLEEDVTSFFKYVGYPCQISKSNILAVGSPHAWPSLLSTIMWIIELLDYNETSVQFKRQQICDNDSEKVFSNYLSNAYGLFLAGEDLAYQNFEEEFIQSISYKRCAMEENVAARVAINEALRKEGDEIEGRQQYIPTLASKEMDYKKDVTKFLQLLNQLSTFKEQLVSKVKVRENDIGQLKSTLSSLHQCNNELRAKVSTQSISSSDVMRMLDEKEKAEKALMETSQIRQSLQRKLWEIEISLRDRVQKLESTVNMYMLIADDLKVVPSTARNARGMDLQIKIDVRAKKKEFLLNADVKYSILPSLLTLHSELVSNTSSLESDLADMSANILDAGNTCADVKARRSSVGAAAARTEETYRTEKQAYHDSDSLKGEEISSLHARSADMQAQINKSDELLYSLEQQQRELRAAERRYAHSFAAEKSQLLSAVLSVISKSASHRESSGAAIRQAMQSTLPL